MQKKYYLNFAPLSICILSWNAAIARESAIHVKLDKGHLNLGLLDIKRAYELVYEFPPECSGSRLDVSFSEGLLSIKHAGRFCHTGAKVNLYLPLDSNKIDLLVYQGTVLLNEDLYARAREVHVKVLSGIIQSLKVKVNRSIHGPGVVGHQIKIGKISLGVEVLSGSVRI